MKCGLIKEDNKPRIEELPEEEDEEEEEEDGEEEEEDGEEEEEDGEIDDGLELDEEEVNEMFKE